MRPGPFFYGDIDKHPLAVIKIADSSDIINSLKFAKTNGLELAVRSGGHSIAGYSSTEGGIVLDLGGMKKLEIDENAQTVWAETGLTAREVSETADKHNLAIGFGDTGRDV